MLPRDRILHAFKMALQSQVPVNGDGTPKWKIRHWRNRETTHEEMPCLAIRFVGDDVAGAFSASDSSPSIAEQVMDLNLELVIDTEIPPESDRDTADDPDDGLDETGFRTASPIIETALETLFVEGEEVNNLGGLIWDARYDGSGDNDDIALPDRIRLAERVTLVYRVRAEAPHVLLTGE
jgi:hypothetical protein